MFALSAATDFIDGKLARKYELVSNFGKFMDPLADKFLIIGALLAAVPVYEEFEWALIISLLVIVFRELAVSSMRLIAKNAARTCHRGGAARKDQDLFTVYLRASVIARRIHFRFQRLFRHLPSAYLDVYGGKVFFTIYSGIQYFHTYKRFIFDS